MAKKKAAVKEVKKDKPEAGRHKWEKATSIAQKDSRGTFHIYRCDSCNAEFKRRGEKWNPPETACKKSTAVLVKVKDNIAKATPEEAKATTTQVKEIFEKMGRSWWELGAAVKKAIEARVPEALGKSAHEWMEHCFGDSWLKIYRAHRIMKAMQGVEMDKLTQISEGNAYALARLPEKDRKAPETIKKAIELKNEDFKELVDKKIAKKTGINDPMVKLTDALGFSTAPKSFGEVVKAAIQKAAQVLSADIDTKQGRIDCVEAIFADYTVAYQDWKAPEAIEVETADGDIEADDTINP